MSKKPTGLAAFTGGRGVPEQQDQAKPAQAKRDRAKGDMIALTVRVTKADWMRLSNLAMAQGVSIQALGIEGFSAVLAKQGLPPMAE